MTGDNNIEGEGRMIKGVRSFSVLRARPDRAARLIDHQEPRSDQGDYSQVVIEMMNNNVSDPGNDAIQFISNRMSAGARRPPTDHPLDLTCELVSTEDMVDRVFLAQACSYLP